MHLKHEMINQECISLISQFAKILHDNNKLIHFRRQKEINKNNNFHSKIMKYLWLRQKKMVQRAVLVNLS